MNDFVSMLGLVCGWGGGTVFIVLAMKLWMRHDEKRLTSKVHDQLARAEEEYARAQLQYKKLMASIVELTRELERK